MLPLLAVPVGIFIIKSLVKNSVSGAIAEGVKETKSEVLHTLHIYQTESIIKIFFNIIVFLIATLLIPKICNKDISILIICSVYMASIIEGAISAFKRIPILLQIIFVYKFNIMSYIYDETYNKVLYETRREVSNLNFLKKIMNNLFGESEYEYAKRIATTSINGIYKKVINIIGKVIIVFLAYICVFRFLIAPFLMENVTGLSMIKSAVYPIFYSLDYFLGLSLLEMFF